MDTRAAVPTTVDEYIAGFPKDVQAVLRKVRRTVRAAAPQATEVISYRMPALRQHGVLIYYAAFAHHIGFYPPIRGNAALERAAAPFAGPKGNLRFPLDQPIPYDLIRRLTALRVAQDAAPRKASPSEKASRKKAPPNKAAHGRSTRGTPTPTNTPTTSTPAKSPSRLIDERVAQLGDWRGRVLSRVRALIRQADPAVLEERKWRGVPVWSHDGIICTGETYREVVKLTFARGAALNDPKRLFNASLEGNTRRAIDLREGDAIDAAALKALVRAAVALNVSKTKR